MDDLALVRIGKIINDAMQSSDAYDDVENVIVFVDRKIELTNKNPIVITIRNTGFEVGNTYYQTSDMTLATKIINDIDIEVVYVSEFIDAMGTVAGGRSRVLTQQIASLLSGRILADKDNDTDEENMILAQYKPVEVRSGNIELYEDDMGIVGTISLSVESAMIPFTHKPPTDPPINKIVITLNVCPDSEHGSSEEIEIDI